MNCTTFTKVINCIQTFWGKNRETPGRTAMCFTKHLSFKHSRTRNTSKWYSPLHYMQDKVTCDVLCKICPNFYSFWHIFWCTLFLISLSINSLIQRSKITATEAKHFCDIHNWAVQPLWVMGGTQLRKAHTTVFTKLKPTLILSTWVTGHKKKNSR